ncbi:MAG: bifunctional transaldolase/phosoglucose isomerase [Actinomycetota bacterium]|nr:bifunctional transaldolase/phosoglucose isomerase [Actinomycetota bacterium]
MTTEAAASSRLGALSSVGTSVWLDAIRRSMIETGELERLVREDAVVGVTANPTIFEKAILGSPDYDERLAELTAEGADTQAIYETLAVEDVQAAADVLRPVHEETGGRDGYASLEVAPELARDTEGTVAAAAAFWERLDRPNAMIKIPATDEGLAAIRRSTAAGINVNVTLLFSVDAYEHVAEAYIAGLEDRVGRGEPVEGIASVASFFVSRVDTAVDRLLSDAGREELGGRAGIANARRAYARFREIFSGERFAALRERGARAQRPLWASTGVKNPRYRETMYVEELAGPDAVNTMPMATLLAFQQRGEVADRLTGSAAEAERTLAELAQAGVDLDEVTARLLDEGIEAFADSMERLLDGIERRRSAVVAGRPVGLDVALSEAQARRIAARVEWARERDVGRRVWRRDHTLWGEESDEIADRLGWLRVSEQMLEHVDELEALARDVPRAGFTDCALLGMGGSSLAPEVMRQTFPARPDFLELHVLDSTHPDAVTGFADALPADRTVFIVSSKSGTTLETSAALLYFKPQVRDPSHFTAITDPGTPLVELAEQGAWGRVFLSPEDIGGRYAALAPFGLVPAALMGVDVRELLERAQIAVQSADPSVRCEGSLPLWLGLAIGELARAGRDKLTFVVSEPIGSFGLWVEQLVAESTGKDGKGIVPIVEEPLTDPDRYGDDRVFVHIRGPDDPATEEVDARLAALADAGHPVLTVPFEDALDLGALFFTWEFAVAVASAVLGVNAFDQPNVLESKEIAAQTLETYVQEGHFPPEDEAVEDTLAVFGAEDAPGAREALADFLAGAAPPAYVATLAYAPPSGRGDAALERLRVAVRDHRRAATTVGYGPRYLHSTGQLHKGGPPTGVFIQVTTDARETVEVPEAGYGFEVLIAAQAEGDRKALRSRELPLLHVHLAGDPEEGLERLADLVAGALSPANPEEG